MNSADSQLLASELETMGYGWTHRPEDADVIVLNTCVVRQQAEDKVLGRLGSLRSVKAARPGTVIALMGCLVGRKPSRALAERFPEVDVFIPPSEPQPLIEFLSARSVDEAARQIDDANVADRWALQDQTRPGALTLPAHQRGKLVSAHVPIVYGCSRVCSFCIIPSRRGPERSRPAEQIVAHVESLVTQGVREVTLLGQIVDRYGFDVGQAHALPRLLERLSDIEQLARIRFLTSHPNYVTDDLLDSVARLPKVMEHIEVPVQAGHDDVLARMRRGYGVDDYRQLVSRIRARIPGVAIHTDVIVGFPGETEDQFQATFDLLAELKLDKAHIAKFSPRPGTVAALRFPDDLTPAEKEHRRQRLDRLQESVCAEINRAHLGRTVEVLVESRDRQRWRGRTRTNKLVFFEDGRNLVGQAAQVEVAWAGPWSMIGHPADAPAAGTAGTAPVAGADCAAVAVDTASAP